MSKDIQTSGNIAIDLIPEWFLQGLGDGGIWAYRQREGVPVMRKSGIILDMAEGMWGDVTNLPGRRLTSPHRQLLLDLISPHLLEHKDYIPTRYRWIDKEFLAAGQSVSVEAYVPLELAPPHYREEDVVLIQGSPFYRFNVRTWDWGNRTRLNVAFFDREPELEAELVARINQSGKYRFCIEKTPHSRVYAIQRYAPSAFDAPSSNLGQRVLESMAKLVGFPNSKLPLPK